MQLARESVQENPRARTRVRAREGRLPGFLATPSHVCPPPGIDWQSSGVSERRCRPALVFRSQRANPTGRPSRRGAQADSDGDPIDYQVWGKTRRVGTAALPARSGPKAPSRPTTKRLFAVSGNRCAFPTCATPLVDPQSGSIVGEMCHIKGEKLGAARYDAGQTDSQRHGFDNLILLCNVHHKIVDDDETAYTVDRLLQMKQQHESKHAEPPAVDKATADRFVAVAISNSKVRGSVIASYGQTGGQTAHTIHNYYGGVRADEEVVLEAKLEMEADIGIINAFGCPGMRLTVICRSARPAKIQSAHLLIDEVDMMDALRRGFGGDFHYTPLPGSTETMDVTLLPLSRPNAQEGYVLDRDDVVRFFYPLPLPPTGLVLKAKPQHLSIVVRFFDDSERVVLAGKEIAEVLKNVLNVFQNRPGELNATISFGVRVKSTTFPRPDMAEIIGKINPKAIRVAKPGDKASPQTKRKKKR